MLLVQLAELMVYKWLKAVCLCVNEGGRNHNHCT